MSQPDRAERDTIRGRLRNTTELRQEGRVTRSGVLARPRSHSILSIAPLIALQLRGRRCRAKLGWSILSRSISGSLRRAGALYFAVSAVSSFTGLSALLPGRFFLLPLLVTKETKVCVSLLPGQILATQSDKGAGESGVEIAGTALLHVII